MGTRQFANGLKFAKKGTMGTHQFAYGLKFLVWGLWVLIDRLAYGVKFLVGSSRLAYGLKFFSWCLAFTTNLIFSVSFVVH
jgi:hypothetical protein